MAEESDSEDWGNDADLVMAPDTDDESGENYDYGSDAENEGGFDDFYDASDFDEDGDGKEDETGENAEENAMIVLENTFYEAEDSFSQKQYDDALKKYEDVVRMEKDPANAAAISDMAEGPWTIRSLSKIVSIHINLGKTDTIVDQYKRLLDGISDGSVSVNVREDAINGVLKHSALTGMINQDIVNELYDTTLANVANTDRLWVKICLSQAQLYLNAGDRFFSKMPSLLALLYERCRGDDGKFDKDKASDLLEVYALEMRYLFLTNDYSSMKNLYPRTKGADVVNAVEDSRTMGPLREYGGRMWMHFRKWTNAYNEFFDAFKAYEEAGQRDSAKSCVKYLVLANIVARGEVNPFAAREIAAYSQYSDIEAMKNLRDAFHNFELEKFEAILKCRQNGIVTDPFIKNFADDLLSTMRIKVLKRYIRPYRTIRLDFLAKKLCVETPLAQKLLERLILDEEIFGKIDQIGGHFEKATERRAQGDLDLLSLWSEKLDLLRKNYAPLRTI